MPVITLPDGSERQFENSVTVRQVAQAIGPGLAKATLAGEIDNQLVDASHTIEADATYLDMVGVVGSSPIVPTKPTIRAPLVQGCPD